MVPPQRGERCLCVAAMLGRIAGTGTSAILSVLYATGILNNGAPGNASSPNVSLVENTSTPTAESIRLGCDWWVPAYGRSDNERCIDVSMRLAMTSALEGATQLAFDCARVTGESCIFSYDVGFSIPAVFVWNASEGRMMTFITPQRDVAFEAMQPKAYVSVGDPLEDGVTFRETFQLRQRTRIEYVAVGMRMHTAVLEGVDAYCIQMLNHTISTECSGAFDM